MTRMNYKNLFLYFRIRSLGSAALTLCYVACGALDGFEIEYTKIWDVAAGSIIVEEAGGVIKNMWGKIFKTYPQFKNKNI